MGRSTFDGPILVGDNRFGPLRNLGSPDLVQSSILDLSNTVPNTANFGGNSGVFVDSNGILNGSAVIFTPGTVYPPVVVTPTADPATSGNIYRGWVGYVPVGSDINDILIDYGTTATLSTGSITGITVSVGNAFNGAQYASVASFTASGRQALTFSAAQLAAMNSTTLDIPQLGSNPVSQIVITFVIAFTGATGTPTISAGKLYTSIRYNQLDQNTGTATTYPYGNFD